MPQSTYRCLRTATACLRTLSAFVGLCTIPAPCLLAQNNAAGSKPAVDTTAYTFKRVYKAGEANRYKLTLHTNINGAQNVEMQFAMNYKENVKSIAADGAVQIVMEFEKFAGAINGQELPAELSASLPKIVRTVDKDGKILSTTLDGSQGMMGNAVKQMMDGQSNSERAFWPSHPVKVGESWDIHSDDPNSKSTGKATLVGTETVHGVKTLKVKIVSDTKSTPKEGPAAGQEISVHFEGVSNIDPVSGRMVRLSGKGGGEIASAGKMTMSTELALLGDKDDKETDGKQDAKAGDKP